MKEQKSFKEKLLEIDAGRFIGIINTLDVQDICAECDHFNPTIKDTRKGYRCKCMPSCIAVTLHPFLQSYLWHKLNWIDQDEHYRNIGLKND